MQALPNGAPTSKPSSPALIETKEPNGGAQASGSTSEAEEQEAQVGSGQGGLTEGQLVGRNWGAVGLLQQEGGTCWKWEALSPAWMLFLFSSHHI